MEREKRLQTSNLRSLKRKRRLLTCLRRISRITMIISFILLFTLYFKSGNSFHEKQITQPASLPHKFFPSHSRVADYPFGNLQPVIKLLGDEELIFVMYYAPWCAQSVRVRGEFMRAAKVLYNSVKFAAINCWFPEGECRQRMKFYSYPELFIYHSGVSDGYRFTGIKEAEYFVKFAESFLFPLKSLTTERQITEFIAQNDNTVIGYFDFNSSPQPPGPGFHQFYLTAIRIIAYDFYQPVKFGVVTSQSLARSLNMSSPNQFILTRVGNTTLKYPVFYNITAKNMTAWILHYRQKNIAPWLVPPGVKSLTLSLHMQKGPAVFIFAPTNPLIGINPYRDMVHLASYAFRSCGNHTMYYQDMIRTYIQSSVVQNQYALEYNKKCLEKKSSVYQSDLSSSNRKCCVSLLTGSKKASQNSVCEYCIQKNIFDSDTVCDIGFKSEADSFWSPTLENSCSDFYQYYNVNEHHSVCCRKGVTGLPNLHIKKVSGKVRRNTDPFVINGENILHQQYLNKLTLQKMKHLPKLEEMAEMRTLFSDILNGNITGLECMTNKTIDFYYVDSVYHSVFLEQLNIPSSPKKASVILVDLKDETLYLLREKLSYRNLGHFVKNYTEGVLSPYRKSTEVTTSSECSKSNSVCITEVTASTFQEVVMRKNKDVLLMFYSHICGFCSQMSKVFLTTAQYFKGAKDLVFSSST
ncbi:thioredoxin domain-containing protein 11-like isoform X2 [Mercenaria mercenaria]|uniref:thioredoxin domain-containing protein 11-like isoform X2 n=1 Tax=Mercenaria mercenaria TaxID=6596 RepID=UPI00234E9187|nr:thioredoxin domain-containing protein 11-like isoform X2 [Mercenaria mercenaria]